MRANTSFNVHQVKELTNQNIQVAVIATLEVASYTCHRGLLPRTVKGGKFSPIHCPISNSSPNYRPLRLRT